MTQTVTIDTESEPGSWAAALLWHPATARERAVEAHRAALLANIAKRKAARLAAFPARSEASRRGWRGR